MGQTGRLNECGYTYIYDWVSLFLPYYIYMCVFVCDPIILRTFFTDESELHTYFGIREEHRWFILFSQNDFQKCTHSSKRVRANGNIETESERFKQRKRRKKLYAEWQITHI